MSSTQTVLELQHISKSFPGVKALDDVNFSLKEGTVHVLCGENGAGKSTLMKIIDGIYQADEGDLFLNQKSYSCKGKWHCNDFPGIIICARYDIRRKSVSR